MYIATYVEFRSQVKERRKRKGKRCPIREEKPFIIKLLANLNFFSVCFHSFPPQSTMRALKRRAPGMTSTA